MTTDDESLLAGRYRLDQPIGRGGMGEVWRATDTVLGREVAVKMIDLRRVPDGAGAARFEREAKVTAGLSNPNVVTVHDTGVEGETAYLVMELLPGPSLAERLEQGPLPVDEVTSVARQVASALGAAHARGLVHRDIKPANIVYAGDGRVRVLDFGITQLGETTEEQHLTATHTVMGTAEYLAPEQATGGRVDGRADLYALGCVLFALLAGRAPFRGPTPVATMMMHTSDPVPDIRELRPDTPAWLAGLVDSLLAKSPADRPAGADAVVEAIESRSVPAAAATTVLPAATVAASRVAPTPPPPAYADEPERRGSAALWVLAVVAIIALALLAWWLFSDQGGRATPAASASASTTSAAPTTSSPPPTTPPPATVTTTATPTPVAPDPAPVADASSALSDEVKQLEQDGTIDKDAAKVVNDPLKDLDKALKDEDAAAVVEARDTLVEDYRAAVQDGTIPAEAAASLDPLVQDLSNAVDTYAG